MNLSARHPKSENSFFYYPAIVNTLKEYSALAERYKRILKNTIDLPALNISMPAIPKTSKGGPSVMEEPPADLPTQLLEAYNKVMALQQAAPGLDFPLPPSKEYDLCFDCNFEEQQTNYDRAKKKWDSLFLAYENDLTEQAVAVQRMLDLMFDPAEAQRMDKIHADMNGVMAFAFQRAEKKLNLLVEQFGKDYKIVPLIVETAVALERQKSLRGDNEELSPRFYEITKSSLEGFDDLPPP